MSGNNLHWVWFWLIAYAPLSQGDSVAEIGASYIHGPCEENPVFCLARDYGLLDPMSLLEENQAIDYDERPPWIPNWFSSSGRNQAALALYHCFCQWAFLYVVTVCWAIGNRNIKHFKWFKYFVCLFVFCLNQYLLCFGWCVGQRLSAEDMSPSLGMFNELLDDTFQYEHEKSTPWDSLGHFLKSEVCVLLMTVRASLSWWDLLQKTLASVGLHMYALSLCDVQTRRRAAVRWTKGEKTPCTLLLCGVSALLKMECFTNAAHTLDELDLPGFNIYKGLKGLDCELPGFVFHSLTFHPNSKICFDQCIACAPPPSFLQWFWGTN